MADLSKARINGVEYDLKDATARQNSGGNVDLGVTGATVGQTVKISAVDENGVPTAWLPTDFPSGGANVTDEQVTEAVSNWLEENPDAVSGGGRLVMEYVHDDSKLDYVINLVGYDAETGVWTTDGKVNLNEVNWRNYSIISLINPEYKMETWTTSGNPMKDKLLPPLHGEVTVVSENTFTFTKKPTVTAFTPTDYVLIPSIDVTISNLPDVKRLRIVLDGQKCGASAYRTFASGQWFNPSNSSLSIKNAYGSYASLYGLYVCDFYIENGYIHGIVKTVFCNNNGAGYDFGVYIPTAATRFPNMMLASYTSIGHEGIPYKYRARIYDMEGEPWVF